MKRLTISISDNLFEKLDRIENKSLFIRKLVERELEMLEDVPENGNQPWTQDITLLKGSVDELFSKMNEFEKHFMERASISHDQESTSGSVILYKDRLHLNAVEKRNDPVIVPVGGETVTAQASGSSGKGMELHTAEEMPSEETFDGMVIPACGQNPAIVSAFNLPEIPEDMEIPRLTSPVEWKMPEKMTGSGSKDLCDKDEQGTPVAPARELQLMSAGESTLAIPDLNRKVNSVSEPVPVIPVFEQQVPQASEPAPVMPGFNQQVIPISEPATIMPDFNQHLSPAGEQPIVMPQFKLPFAEGKEKPLFMPDMKGTERTTESGGVKTSGNPEHMIPFMPIPETINQASGPGKLKEPLFKLHGIPEPQKTETMPPFIAPSMPETQENVQLPYFMAPKPPAMPPMQQQPKPSLADSPAGHSATGTNKQGKLEGNILMYMPRGAKVKKEIIKSLVSKQFSDRDIEAKISELVTTGVLVLNADNGEHYLIRP
jgi:hypothetical protein